MKNRMVAHRGAWKDFGFPQNSIAAFQKAQTLNLSGIELDIHLTKDDQLVVFHDEKINDKLISESTYSELASYRLSNGEPLPLLSDFLKRWDRMINLWIELKSEQISLHQRIILIDRLLMQIKGDDFSKINVISFELATLRMLREADKTISIFYLGNEFSPYFLHSKGISGMDVNKDYLLQNRQLVSECRQNDLRINTWTVNTKQEAKIFLEMGVEFITTDEIILLLES